MFETALIVAGGQGRRLRPLTSAIPKPLLPVGEKPIVQIILEHLASYGISEVFISVNYKKELIKNYLRDGSRFGVRITYIEEDSATGTAGSLSLLPESVTTPILVSNADIMCDLDLEKLYRVSTEFDMVLTAVEKRIPVPFGVIVSDDTGRLVDWTEKPEISITVNAGIYCIGDRAINLTRSSFDRGTKLDMPDLWRALIGGSLNVGVFLHEGKWSDLGRMEDYMALSNMEENEE